MNITDFDYTLPEELIAQFPADQRDESRLLIVHRENRQIQEDRFRSLIHYLNEGDVLVLNDTCVFPARLLGKKDPGGAAIEMLLLNKLNHSDWEIIAYRASRLKTGTRVLFGDDFYCEVLQVLDEGKFHVRFFWQNGWEETLSRYGKIPLPPYIARQDGEYAFLDKERYQTIYARYNDLYNSAAAPTAGLHFTDELLDRLHQHKIITCHVTLKVGLDTFLPLRTDNIEEHRMHSEAYHLPDRTAQIIEKAYQDRKRIVAVGTTSVRVLESAATAPGKLQAGEGNTNLYIYPGYQFQIINAMITNFHLPRTTLLLLVSAFMGNDLRQQAYQYALDHRFRFYSYGDAMFIL